VAVAAGALALCVAATTVVLRLRRLGNVV